MTSRRQSRVSELLQRELAQLIAYELRDPRLAFVSVTHVEVTPDLRLARVYISTLGDASTGSDAVAALEHAGGFLRRALSERVDLRFMPELRFYFDESAAASLRINALLDQVSAAPTADAEQTAEPPTGDED